MPNKQVLLNIYSDAKTNNTKFVKCSKRIARECYLKNNKNIFIMYVRKKNKILWEDCFLK